MNFELIHADCRNVMANMGDDTVDAVITDPPYHLASIVKRFKPGSAPPQFGTDGVYQRAARGFMGAVWDGGDIAFDATMWAEVLRVLKPGGFLVSFGGTRTHHRMACAIEDAGFEIRDMLCWIFGSGFPKGSVVDGWGPALKPGHEPICLARKPFAGSVAANRAAWGTGALNIDGCRVPGEKPDTTRGAGGQHGRYHEFGAQGRIVDDGRGRFPANVLHDGSDEVLAGFPADAGARAPVRGDEPSATTADVYNDRVRVPGAFHGDQGSAARFFYCAKASKRDRDEGCEHLSAPYEHSGPRGHSLNGDGSPLAASQDRANIHPTVKPTDLMRWCVRLVTPPGGLVFDPFTGSGSTGKAAMLEGMRFLGAEMTPEYVPIARARIEHAARRS